MSQFSSKRWQIPFFAANNSKLVAVPIVVLIVTGAIMIFCSVNLLLTLQGQPSTPATPSPTSVNLMQWSGYLVASDFQNRQPVVTSISASWVVPMIAPSKNDTFSVVWIGIGGYGEKNLIQTGTVQQCVGGRTDYFAWYELLPKYLSHIANIRVQPGDRIEASINLVNGTEKTWLIEIKDVTRNQSFKRAVFYDSSRLSAEWIVERPNVNDEVSTLAHFGSITFSECTATVNGKNGTISDFSYVQFVMVDSQKAPLVTVSPLSANGSLFTVTYLESSDAISQNSFLTVKNYNVAQFEAFPAAVFLQVHETIMFTRKLPANLHERRCTKKK